MPDSSDNCPAWPNADQSLPPWSLATDDPDCDGFGSATEQSLGTDPMEHCAITGAPNDEEVDAWPSDDNDDQDSDLGDIIALFHGRFLSPPGYNARADFDADSDIDVRDLIIGFGDLIRTYGIPMATCT